MARAPLDIILTARDQATTVFDRVNDRFISSTRNMVLGFASLTTAIRLAGRASDLWGTVTETAADRASNSLATMLEGQLKVKDAWADLAKAIPFVGHSIASVLKSFSTGSRELLADLKKIDAAIAQTEARTLARSEALELRQSKLRGEPGSAQAQIAFEKRKAIQQKELTESRANVTAARRLAEVAREEAAQERRAIAHEAIFRETPVGTATVLLLELEEVAEKSEEKLKEARKAHFQFFTEIMGRRRASEAEIAQMRIAEEQKVGDERIRQIRRAAEAEAAIQRELRAGAQLRRETEAREAQDAALQQLRGFVPAAEELFEAPPITRGDVRRRRNRLRNAERARTRRIRNAQRRRGGRPGTEFLPRPGEGEIPGIPLAEEVGPRPITRSDLAEEARRQKTTPQRVTDPEATALLKTLAPDIVRALLDGLGASDISGK